MSNVAIYAALAAFAILIIAILAFMLWPTGPALEPIRDAPGTHNRGLANDIIGNL